MKSEFEPILQISGVSRQTFVQYNIVNNIYGVCWNYQGSLCDLSYTVPFISILGVVYKTFRGKMNVTSRKLPQTEVRTEGT